MLELSYEYCVARLRAHLSIREIVELPDTTSQPARSAGLSCRGMHQVFLSYERAIVQQAYLLLHRSTAPLVKSC